VDDLRERCAAALQASAGSHPRRQAGAALATALVLGRQESLDRDTVSALRQSGLAHILSVSGLHVVLVSAILWGALTIAGVPPRARRWLLMPALATFALVAGGSPPVLRATAATLAYLLTRQAGRPVLPLPAMWAVVGGLVLLEPAALLQPGFQLSAGVSLALIRWVGPLVEAAEMLPRWLGSALAVAAVGQLASWPLVGVTFACVPPWGAVANLLAAPLGLPLVGVALVTVLLAPLGLAGPLLSLVGLGDAALLGVSTLGGGTAWLFAPVPVPLLLAGASLLLVGLTRIRGAWLAAVALAAASAAWTLAPAWSARPAGEARLLPVGEGLALLLRSSGTAVLVDTGRSAMDALRGLAAARVRRLDALVLTHADADHTGGAATLLDRVRVGDLVLPEAIAGRGEVQPLLALAARRGVRVVRVAAGEDRVWGDIRCRVAWPPAGGGLEDNDLSLVAVFTVGGKRVLVTGDVEAAGEASVVAGGEDLRAEVLQLPHHGSRTSSSSLLLGASRPRVTLAGTGLRPRFAYPDPSVRARVRALPAVMVLQSEEVSRLWWSSDGAIMIGTRQPVCLPMWGADR
jgi:competence protein ComEC